MDFHTQQTRREDTGNIDVNEGDITPEATSSKPKEGSEGQRYPTRTRGPPKYLEDFKKF